MNFQSFLDGGKGMNWRNGNKILLTHQLNFLPLENEIFIFIRFIYEFHGNLQVLNWEQE